MIAARRFTKARAQPSGKMKWLPAKGSNHEKATCVDSRSYADGDSHWTVWPRPASGRRHQWPDHRKSRGGGDEAGFDDQGGEAFRARFPTRRAEQAADYDRPVYGG